MLRYLKYITDNRRNETQKNHDTNYEMDCLDKRSERLLSNELILPVELKSDVPYQYHA